MKLRAKLAIFVCQLSTATQADVCNATVAKDKTQMAALLDAGDGPNVLCPIADLPNVYRRNYSPFRISIDANQVEIANLLISKGANPNALSEELASYGSGHIRKSRIKKYSNFYSLASSFKLERNAQLELLQKFFLIGTLEF